MIGPAGKLGAKNKRQVVLNIKSVVGKKKSVVSNVSNKAAKIFDTKMLISMVVPNGNQQQGVANNDRNVNEPQRNEEGNFAGLGAAGRGVDGANRVKFTQAGSLIKLKQILEPRRNPRIDDFRRITNLGNLEDLGNVRRNNDNNINQLDPRTPGGNIVGLGDQAQDVGGVPIVREPNQDQQNNIQLAQLTPRERRAIARGEPQIPPEEIEDLGNIDSMTLNEEEKPRILAVIEEDIRTNGSPRQITLIIKKLTGTRYRAISYSIFKKSVFTDINYDNGTEVDTFRVSNYSYFEVATNAGFNHNEIFTYTDRSIRSGRVYAYKVKVRYDGDLESNPNNEIVTPVAAAIIEQADQINQVGPNALIVAGGGGPAGGIGGIGGIGRFGGIR